MVKKLNDFNIFAMNVFKTAQDRKVMNNFDPATLLKRIQNLPSYSNAIQDPQLCKNLEVEFKRWRDSKNLYVLLSMIRQLQEQAGVSVAIENPPEVEDDPIDEENPTDNQGDEDGESSTKDLMAGLRKYEELVEGRANISAFRTWFLKIKFFGSIGDAVHRSIMNVQFKIYNFRGYVKDKKERIDNVSYELMERAIDAAPDGIHKTVVLIIAWLILKILGLALIMFLVVTRPSILLEKMGLDSDTLPLPTE